jgi:hypothetical protein
MPVALDDQRGRLGQGRAITGVCAIGGRQPAVEERSPLRIGEIEAHGTRGVSRDTKAQGGRAGRVPERQHHSRQVRGEGVSQLTW